MGTHVLKIFFFFFNTKKMSDLPKSLRKTLKELDATITSLESNLESFFKSTLAQGTKDVISVEQANLNVALGNTIATVFDSYLRTQGENADDHDVKGELARAQAYKEKIIEFQNAKSKRKLKVNPEGAQRFVDHALNTGKKRKAIAIDSVNSVKLDSEKSKKSKKSAKKKSPKRKNQRNNKSQFC